MQVPSSPILYRAKQLDVTVSRPATSLVILSWFLYPPEVPTDDAQTRRREALCMRGRGTRKREGGTRRVSQSALNAVGALVEGYGAKADAAVLMNQVSRPPPARRLGRRPTWLPCNIYRDMNSARVPWNSLIWDDGAARMNFSALKGEWRWRRPHAQFAL